MTTDEIVEALEEKSATLSKLRCVLQHAVSPLENPAHVLRMRLRKTFARIEDRIT